MGPKKAAKAKAPAVVELDAEPDGRNKERCVIS